MSRSEKVAVFYHAPCLDGAAAAWAAYEKWGNDAQYIPINHGSLDATKKLILRYIDTSTHVVFADYAPPRPLIDEIAAASKDVAIYDHHASSIRALEGYHNDNVKMVLDTGRSGGAIVYNALFPEKNLPQAVELAQMVDLEQVDRKDFFSIAAYMDSFPLGNINEIVRTFTRINKSSLDTIIKHGQDIRRYHATSIEKAMESAAWAKVSILPDTDPVHVPLINASPHYLGREFSIRLRQLAEKSAPGYVALSWFEDKGVVRVSVRTNGIPDAGKVAAYIGNKDLGHGLGGGGHSMVAAAQFTIDQFNTMFKRLTQEEIVSKLTDHSVVIKNPNGTLLGEEQGKGNARS